jgi:hypothetical protein
MRGALYHTDIIHLLFVGDVLTEIGLLRELILGQFLAIPIGAIFGLSMLRINVFLALGSGGRSNCSILFGV